MFARRQPVIPFDGHLSRTRPFDPRPLLLTLISGKTGRVNTPAERRVLAELVNEFAAVRLSLDLNGNGPRLLVEDLESGEQVFLDPLELSSFTEATLADREDWLRVGNYRGERRPREQP